MEGDVIMTKDEFTRICAEEINNLAKESTDEVLVTILGLKLALKITERIYKHE